MSRQERLERAGDYVLGLMDEAERERAERDLIVDAEFRDCVMELAERFHVFDRDVAPVEPPRRMWDEIARRISDMPQMGASEIAEMMRARAGLPAPDPERKGFLRIKRPGAQALGGVRGTLMAACLLAAMGVGYLVGQSRVLAPDPVVVVLLVDDADRPGAFVEAFGDDSVRVIPLVDFEVPEGKTLEVWTLYDEAVGPVSLGTFERPSEVRLFGPGQPTPRPQQLYEITLEDAPGSPVGRPTGPILVKGLAVAPPG